MAMACCCSGFWWAGERAESHTPPQDGLLRPHPPLVGITHHPATHPICSTRCPPQYPHPVVMPDGGLVVAAGKTLYKYKKTNNPYRFAKEFRYDDCPHPARA